MIRLGVCTGPDNLEKLAAAGFDFAEFGLSWIHGLSEEEYQKVLHQVQASPIKVEACNGMLPGEIKVTGPDASEAAQREYLDKAFRRAQALGVKVVVFGSGAARGVPEGFPQDEAWRQIAAYLKVASEYCGKYGIDVAIEPLRRAECNIMNLVTEGTLMAAMIDHPQIGVLGDTHHMICGCEPYSAFTQAGKLLKHVHISHSMGNEKGRDFPEPGDGGDYEEVFRVLKESGYEGRVSIEGGHARTDESWKQACDLLAAARDC